MFDTASVFDMNTKPQTAIVRILQRVRITEDGGCWEWTGSISDGYGRAGVDRKVVLVHRYVYEQLVGPITDETLDHTCRVRHCCNPAHLRPLSSQDNLRLPDTDYNANKMHCPRGHALVEGNLVPSALRDGKRSCATCRTDYQREYARQKRAGVLKPVVVLGGPDADDDV